MKIPKKVKILFKEYKVEVLDDLHSDDSDLDLYGRILYLSEVIRDNPQMFEVEG